jgi:GDP-L-fucose synthase
MKPSDKIYVAGHRGLAGSAIARALGAAGYRNIITRSHAELDLTDQRATADFFAKEKPDHVFLAAAKVGGIHANRTYPAQFIHQNLAIQTHVIHQSFLHGVQRLLFLGSSCIYPKHAPQPIREDHLLTGPLEPTNEAYAVAKIAGIQMCWAYNQEHGTRFIPLMPNNLYGPGDNFDLLHSHVLPALVRKFHLGKLALEKNWAAIEADERIFGPIPLNLKQALGLPGCASADRTAQGPEVMLWGTGTPLREFLYVDDMAEAALKLMALPWERLMECGVDPDHLLFNVGVGADQTIQSIAAITAQTVGYTGRLAWDQTMPDGTPRKLLDVSRLNTLGWRPRTGLEEGLRRVYAWYQQRAALV